MAGRQHRRHKKPEQLSTALEDYLETILRLEDARGEVRVSNIAERLGVRLPPVTRAVQALDRQGYVIHEARREVRLTEKGRRMAAALSHRHEDVAYFLTEVLGVPPSVAEADTCQVEHGISAETAQRLHEFLEHYQALDSAARQRLRPDGGDAAFAFLPSGRTHGWRA